MNDLSIIIPVKHKDESWHELLHELLSSHSNFEIILVGPDFENLKSEDPRVVYLYSKEGRARQLNLGATKATKSNLWFLHADSRLSNRTLQKIDEKIKENPGAIFYFDLNFLPDGPCLMFLNSIGAYWRSHLLRMPFGDQGFFMSRRTFYSLGLYSENALYGEDHLFIWKAHQRGVEVHPAYSELFTSARKYKNLGWITTTLNHIFLTYKQAFPQFLKYLRVKNQLKQTTAVAIFVKTPGISTIKSRLAADIGKEKAEEFFRLSLKATEALVIEAIKKSGGKLEAYWAVAEKDQLNHSLWSSFKTVSQDNGELGDRLATVYSRLLKKHKRVILIGADLPHLDYKTLLAANFQLSSSTKFVLGETLDGGFYLFGGRQVIERAIWKSVPYSTEDTSAELIKQLGIQNFNFLDKNFDIDYVSDLEELNVYQSESLLNEQKEVISWAKKALG